MHAEKRLLTNTAVLGAGEALGQVAAFVFVVICARVFGSGVLGWYSLGMALGAIAAVLAAVGTQTSLLREIAQRPETAVRGIGGTLKYQLALSAGIVAVLTGALAWFVDDPVGRWIVAAVTTYHLALGVSALLLVPLRARQIMWPSAAISAAQRIVIAIVAVAVAGLGASALPIFLTFPISAVFFAAVSFVAVDRFLGGGLARAVNSPVEQRAVYREGLPFFGTAALDVTAQRLGLLLLTLIVGAESAGIYTAADRLVVTLGMFRVLFLAALFPAVTALVASDRARALELATRSMRLLMLVTIPTAGMLAIFHRGLIDAMFGESFAESSPLLLVLTPLLILRGLNGVWSSQAAAVGLQPAVLRVRIVVVGVFVVSGTALTFVTGPLGLAGALVVAELLQAALLRALLRPSRFLAPCLTLVARPLGAVAVGAVTHAALPALALPLDVAVVGVVIVASMFALGAVRGHDVRYLRLVMSQPAAS